MKPALSPARLPTLSKRPAPGREASPRGMLAQEAHSTPTVQCRNTCPVSARPVPAPGRQCQRAGTCQGQCEAGRGDSCRVTSHTPSVQAGLCQGPGGQTHPPPPEVLKVRSKVWAVSPVGSDLPLGPDHPRGRSRTPVTLSRLKQLLPTSQGVKQETPGSSQALWLQLSLLSVLGSQQDRSQAEWPCSPSTAHGGLDFHDSKGLFLA